MATSTILNSTSGYSNEFLSADNRIKFRLAITGTAASTIQAFVDDGKDIFNGTIILKIKGITESGTTVSLQAKTLNDSDTDFNETGRIFSKDFMGFYNDFKSK